ncbi:hypothetical protein T03_646 [Trichinella britovi]|uniref:Reverse transcriptase Ty1/copia-type domain-containing protein n=1 Tax=Trichinella britovi TaxID=45882 RepID=A0A0V1C971_TRIBR|nr:hypothetical protein T03_646 [Trichinella britovi]
MIYLGHHGGLRSCVDGRRCPTFVVSADCDAALRSSRDVVTIAAFSSESPFHGNLSRGLSSCRARSDYEPFSHLDRWKCGNLFLKAFPGLSRAADKILLFKAGLSTENADVDEFWKCALDKSKGFPLHEMSTAHSTHLEEVINCIPKLASWWRVDFPNVLEMTTTKLSQQLQDMRPSAHYSVLLLYYHCVFDTSILSVLSQRRSFKRNFDCVNGFEDPNNKDMVWHLKRSIYGLEQSAIAWNTKATEILTAIDTEHQLSQPERYGMKSILAG